MLFIFKNLAKQYQFHQFVQQDQYNQYINYRVSFLNKLLRKEVKPFGIAENTIIKKHNKLYFKHTV